jgi:uncharacterized protein YdhG (YjbR/CyaY superfamily)
MSSAEIDAYLARLDDPRRTTLEHVRTIIREIVPHADEGLSYGVPAFLVGGKPVAGFTASKRHLSYLPHSGSVLASMDPSDLEGYEWSKGALRFAVDTPLPKRLVEALISARQRELAG